MSKRIFCLENQWFGTLDKTSVEPIFRLLETTRGLQVPYVRYGVATREEFEFHIKTWKRNRTRCPILYLAFHGFPQEIKLKNGSVTLDDLEKMLAGSCKGRIVHFGSCSTLDAHGHRLNRFLRNTNALAVSGFKTEIDWLQSTVFDLFFLGLLQKIPFTPAGIQTLKDQLSRSVRGLQNDLEFHIRAL